MILEDAHVLVTGGSDGIGRAIAVALADAGARLSVCGRSQKKLDAVRTRLPAATMLFACDLANVTQHGELLDAARDAHGPIDILVNNAGTQTLMDFTRPAPTRPIANEVAVNLTAPLLLTEAALPELLTRPRAAIVQVTSGLALSPKASSPVYCATKSGLRAFTRALRWQLERTSVRVVEVLPPLVDTAMTRGRGQSKMTPEAIASQTVHALRRGNAEVYIGRSKLLRWLVWVAPRLAARITRRM